MAYEEVTMNEEASRCLLCHDAPCSKVCSHGIAADFVRSVRFDNLTGAARRLGSNPCISCSAPCMSVCLRGRIDHPVSIPDIARGVEAMHVAVPQKEADLSLDFLGVHFENPFILSSSVVGSDYEMVKKAFDLGWAGVCFKTIGLFTPNEVSPRFSALKKESNPFIGFKNIEQISDHSLEENIEYLKRLKKEYPTKVIVASIMGQNEEEWEELAHLMELADADIIECNFSCPQMVGENLGSDVGTNPELVRKFTAAVRRGTTLPVIAKMTPNVTRMEVPAEVAVEAGADGLAAINTIKSIMNIDLSTFDSAPYVAGKCSIGGYSGKAVKPIALRFICDMRKDKKLSQIPISGMGGIETWQDAAEFLSMGCENLQVTTSIMQYGYRIIDDLTEGLSDYLINSGMNKVTDVIGRALDNVIDAGELNRDTIEYPRFNHSTCIGCGRCYISCYDGGHQAITMDEEKHIPKMNPKKCVGCQLCMLVCPTNSISASGVRVSKKK